MLKSIQLDEEFIPFTQQNEATLKEELQNKELIAFNSPFEQTQLARVGFEVWSNDWIDVSLLAKLNDNRLAEARIASLGDLEEHFLRTTTKNDLVTKLEQRYGKNFFNHPNILDDPDFKKYGTNDTRITRELWDKLKNEVRQDSFQVCRHFKISQLDERWGVFLFQ